MVASERGEEAESGALRNSRRSWCPHHDLLAYSRRTRTLHDPQPGSQLASDLTMPTFSMPPPPPKPVDPTLPLPTGQKPTSYTDAFRGREAHTKFADPCALAREVRRSCRSRRSPREAGLLTAMLPDPEQESMKCLDKNAYDKQKCTTVRLSLSLSRASENPQEG